MSNIVVQPVQNQAIIRATEIAERLDLPLVTQADAGQQFVLEVSVERLAIRDRRQVRTLPVQVVCSNLRRPSRGRDLLARAIGRTNKTVIDATAGFGRDAFHLASLDRRVTGIERSPVLAELLIAALNQSAAEALRKSIRFICADSRVAIEQLPRHDVIYLDPMFPQRTINSATARKEATLLRGLVGDDPDADELWNLACIHARQRVVVKRSRYAPALGRVPDLKVSGKAVRYDIYLRSER